ARNALDAFGQATLSVHVDSGRITWQTPLARRLMSEYFESDRDYAPIALLDWISHSLARYTAELVREVPPFPVNCGAKRLIFHLHEQTGDGEWLLVLQEESDSAQVEALIACFRLTQKEAEVLYWVMKGKTSPDIGEILSISPRTVNKHLEHVFEKLGVETRTAAANLASSRLRRNITD
ncbi:MAG: hypothetical protein RJA63_760, partial [Pseudomonadota bacterium]